MLARYHIKRGAKAADFPPEVQRGIRIDTRKHTRHCLRPTSELVARFLENTSAWSQFQAGYLALVEERFRQDRSPFDALAERAREEDVFIGCSCPTAKNPDVNHCHTVLALRFMKRHYPKLEVLFP